jgi:hypothetical protein
MMTLQKLYHPQATDNTGGTLIGQATAAQISEWKAKYHYGIYSLETDGHIAYFKNPGRNEVNCAMSKADKDKALDMFEELANITFIGGSNAVLSDDQMFIGIAQELKLKLEGKKAVLVNL